MFNINQLENALQALNILIHPQDVCVLRPFNSEVI